MTKHNDEDKTMLAFEILRKNIPKVMNSTNAMLKESDKSNLLVSQVSGMMATIGKLFISEAIKILRDDKYPEEKIQGVLKHIADSIIKIEGERNDKI